MSNRYSVVMIRVGTFQGQSPSVPIRFTAATLASAAPSMVGKPLRVANGKGRHEESAWLVAGRVTKARFVRDSVVGEVELDPKAPGYTVAKSLFDSLLAIGGTPNLSIDGQYVATPKDGVHDVDSLTFTALTAVPKGACSDLAGCGVTAALSGVPMTNETTATTYNTAAPVTPTGVAGTVTFTVVPDELPVAVAPDVAQLAIANAEKAALEVKLAESDAALVAVKAALAESEKALDNERNKVPVLVALAALAPAYPVEGRTLCELRAALEMAKLAPSVGGRRSMLAEHVAPLSKTHIELLRERMGLVA